ncbi:DUF2795 domain-containing protein [Rhodococcus sp. NPDC078407]|uniref:DUF2795 domain-containing protein n=1 Tax=Rhodococcus sp. NPDC078407 TaxID=3364509 RepID=UPI0037C7BD7C
MTINPIELQRHLAGADYPASKDQLCELAEKNGADEDTMSALRNMKGDSFDGPDAVSAAVSDQS